MSALTQAQAEHLIHREGQYLDTGAWDAWLALFTDDVVFWVPAWKDENEPTSLPDSELSLIYYEGRAALADRIWRLKSGLSAASVPLRRTSHMTSCILVEDHQPEGTAHVSASFAVFQFDPKRCTQHVFFGRYEYELRASEGPWQISRKKTLLANDRIPTVADFYLL